MKKVMILGAGKTGRGFIPRFLHHVKLTFCDQNEELINKLSKQSTYQIHFFNEREAITISYEECCVWGSEAAHQQLFNIDILCISIDCSNYNRIAEELMMLVMQRETPLIIITFENGVDAGKMLLKYGDREAKNNCIILDAGVFCTTENAEGLDMISQDFDYLPIQESGLILPFTNLTQIKNFSSLMKRKLYTYNCLSAVICYMGYCHGYEWLSEAANDESIREEIMKLLPELNEQLSIHFEIPIKDQQNFSDSALQKFSDPYLKDSIVRNARNVKRKLGVDERLYRPLQLLNKTGREVLLKTIACACIYDQREESHQGLNLLENYADEDREAIKIYYDVIMNKLQ